MVRMPSSAGLVMPTPSRGAAPTRPAWVFPVMNAPSPGSPKCLLPAPTSHTPSPLAAPASAQAGAAQPPGRQRHGGQPGFPAGWRAQLRCCPCSQHSGSRPHCERATRLLSGGPMPTTTTPQHGGSGEHHDVSLASPPGAPKHRQFPPDARVRFQAGWLSRTNPLPAAKSAGSSGLVGA